MTCKICSHKVEGIFTHKVLAKHDVTYYKCSNCLFIQTEEPYWLDEAYNTGAINALDVGIMSRNLYLAEKAKEILPLLFPNLNNFIGIDYGGGHGIFVRMIRDLGFNFYRQDIYADNLYARFFDISDLPKNVKFNILTTFEVFEHLPNPLEEIEKMFNYSNILFFSTELQQTDKLDELRDWWYMAPETGQHISFYHQESFKKIAEIFDAHYYTNSQNLHILSKEILSTNPFENIEIEQNELPKKNILQRFVAKINNRINKQPEVIKPEVIKPEVIKQISLTQEDFEYAKQKLGTSKK